MNSAANDLHWDTAYRPPSSTAQHSASFAGSPDLGYPSPVASASSYASPHALTTSTDQASMSFAQIQLSVGPSRVLTRRQRAALEQGQTLGRRAAATSSFPSLNTSEEMHSPARSLFDSPRPQTPDSPQTQRQRLSGSTSLLGPLQMQPPYPPRFYCSVFTAQLLRSLSDRVFL
ncbi:hypothetical protein BDZ89DRAFT_1169117 [Hymenopellis radicata]|nr:hypothetical protein BDZ89DRAFT_1169117 [Hymenopellis radicata]